MFNLENCTQVSKPLWHTEKVSPITKFISDKKGQSKSFGDNQILSYVVII